MSNPTRVRTNVPLHAAQSGLIEVLECFEVWRICIEVAKTQLSEGLL